MEKNEAAPAPAQPAPVVSGQGTALSHQQVLNGLGACLAVLQGAPASEILKLSGEISIGKAVLEQIVTGKMQLVQAQRARAAPGQPGKPSSEPAVRPAPGERRERHRRR